MKSEAIMDVYLKDNFKSFEYQAQPPRKKKRTDLSNQNNFTQSKLSLQGLYQSQQTIHVLPRKKLLRKRKESSETAIMPFEQNQIDESSLLDYKTLDNSGQERPFGRYKTIEIASEGYDSSQEIIKLKEVGSTRQLKTAQGVRPQSKLQQMGNVNINRKKETQSDIDNHFISIKLNQESLRSQSPSPAKSNDQSPNTSQKKRRLRRKRGKKTEDNQDESPYKHITIEQANTLKQESFDLVKLAEAKTKIFTEDDGKIQSPMRTAMRQAIKNKVIEEFEDLDEEKIEELQQVQTEIFKPRDSIVHAVNTSMKDLIKDHVLEVDPSVVDSSEQLQTQEAQTILEKANKQTRIRYLKRKNSADQLKQQLKVVNKKLSDMSQHFQSENDLANAKVKFNRKVSGDRQFVQDNIVSRYFPKESGFTANKFVTKSQSRLFQKPQEEKVVPPKRPTSHNSDIVRIGYIDSPSPKNSHSQGQNKQTLTQRFQLSKQTVKIEQQSKVEVDLCHKECKEADEIRAAHKKFDKKLVKLMQDDKSVRQDLATYECYAGEEINVLQKAKSMIKACNKQRGIHIDIVNESEQKSCDFFDDLLPDLEQVFVHRKEADPTIYLRRQRFNAHLQCIIAKKFHDAKDDPSVFSYLNHTKERRETFYEYFVKE